MTKKSLFIKTAFAAGLLGLAAGGYGLYLWNMPHRDVQAARVDYTLTADALVAEYLADATAADAKYLDAEGQSRVLAITGRVHALRVNQAGETVAVLRGPDAQAGVACSFTLATNPADDALKIGDTITVKGVIRAGAQYSDVLESYTDAVVEKCALL
ncbi:MAG: hypothetical protein Q8M02_05600 [Candidatus Didemnitutus sp.]|nr:hypothetical protein [Candidatus Didemnitutus sp.]